MAVIPVQSVAAFRANRGQPADGLLVPMSLVREIVQLLDQRETARSCNHLAHNSAKCLVHDRDGILFVWCGQCGTLVSSLDAENNQVPSWLLTAESQL